MNLYFYKLCLSFLLIFPQSSFATAGLSFDSVPFEPHSISHVLEVFALLSLISLAPSILMMLSSFTRIVIVLSLLRSALGLQQTPPNIILINLALFLTIFTMMPVIQSIYNQAYKPYIAKQVSIETALFKAQEPIKAFMLKQTREKDIEIILQIAKENLPSSAKEIKFYQLIPAFILSELQTAFQIGFMLFLPFLLVDLIVSAILMTLGMMMLPPMTISLPIKILVFILIDGWSLVVQAIIGSF